jgi:hypothetical protein
MIGGDFPVVALSFSLRGPSFAASAYLKIDWV